MRTLKLNSRLSFAVYCVLVSFTVPVTALAEDVVCPCFTAAEVMRYASHPAKFVCVLPDSQGGLRILIKGQYGAGFGASTDDYEDFECSAYVGIGFEEPRAVFLDKGVGEITHEQFSACMDLIELGDPPECPCLEDCD